MNVITSLLASDGYIVVNKHLIKTIGLHEAIILGELCSEHAYWEKQGNLTDNAFFSTRKNIEGNTGINEHFQRKAFKNLSGMGVISTQKKGLPAVNYYAINYDKLFELLSTSPSRDEELSSSRDEELEVREVQINNNNNNNNNNNSNSSSTRTKKNLHSNKNLRPTLTEIKEYIDEKKLSVDAEKFYNYFEAGDWLDSKGNPVRSWKQKLIVWGSKNETANFRTGDRKRTPMAESFTDREREIYKLG